MLEYRQTEESKRFFSNLLKRSDLQKNDVVKSLCSQDVLKEDDLKQLESALPSDVPAVFGLLLDMRIIRDPDYKASPEFIAKTAKLRTSMADREYKRLVETVDPAQGYGVTPIMQDFGADMRSMNRQLGTIINFIITVVGGFFFGFTGVTYAYPSRQFDLATRFILGLIIATIIFFADLYFVIKNMDAELAARPTAANLATTLDHKQMAAVHKNEAEKKND